jgi:hypothetical protein
MENNGIGVRGTLLQPGQVLTMYLPRGAMVVVAAGEVRLVAPMREIDWLGQAPPDQQVRLSDGDRYPQILAGTVSILCLTPRQARVILVLPQRTSFAHRTAAWLKRHVAARPTRHAHDER